LEENIAGVIKDGIAEGEYPGPGPCHSPVWGFMPGCPGPVYTKFWAGYP